MAINLSTLTPEQLATLKKNNPALYQANIGSLSTTPTATKTPTTLGATDISNISTKQLTDAFAAAGNTKAQELQKNNYDIKTLPSPTTTSTPIADKTATLLPEAENRSSLVEFADMLTQATDMARKRRQASELGILEDYGFKPGQATASTMGQILNLLQTRTDNSYSTLQNAAITAYQDEEKRKATDLENKQSLALQLIGKVDESTLNGLLNAPDFNSAMSMAAGVLKGNKDYTDVRSAEVDGKLTFFGVKDDGTVEKLAEFGSASSGNEYKTYTVDGKIYQYPVDKSGQIVGNVSLVGNVNGTTEPLATYNEVLSIAMGWTGTKEDLKNELNAGKLDGNYDLTDGQMDDIIASWEAKNKESDHLKKVKYDYVLDLIESNISPSWMLTRNQELSDAIETSKNDIQTSDLEDYFDTKFSDEDEKTMYAQLDKVTIKKNNDGSVTISLGDVSRTYDISGGSYVLKN